MKKNGIKLSAWRVKDLLYRQANPHYLADKHQAFAKMRGKQFKKQPENRQPFRSTRKLKDFRNGMGRIESNAGKSPLQFAQTLFATMGAQ